MGTLAQGIPQRWGRRPSHLERVFWLSGGLVLGAVVPPLRLEGHLIRQTRRGPWLGHPRLGPLRVLCLGLVHPYTRGWQSLRPLPLLAWSGGGVVPRTAGSVLAWRTLGLMSPHRRMLL
jgi:hypothetical protein